MLGFFWIFYWLSLVGPFPSTLKAFLNDNPTLPCECTGSPFVDKDPNHIMTGNLNIIINNYFANFSLKVQSTKKMELMIMTKLRKAQLL